ncbi:hypothetical protein [Maridesulfovibrio frigidus]|uniref:hypothetical protein n=1 Tax=Maridesulfovibrio frigidus TaxID=340956 RepID=UPI0012EB2B18|nr:hypothetical protein [Maridesulfovibrio frigidus]
MQQSEKLGKEATARQTRAALLHRLIIESPYHKGLECYQEDIIRVAESHGQIIQTLDTLHELQLGRSSGFRQETSTRPSLKIINEFLEYIFFSTPETYRRISGGE